MDEKRERACWLWLQTRPAEELAIRRVLAGPVASNDQRARPVVVTAFGGNYEEPAGYTVALNGSPVLAVIVCLPSGGAIIWQGPKPLRLNGEDTRAVYAYLESLHMPKSQYGAPYPFTMCIDGERVEGGSFHVRPWFRREPELYKRLCEETPDT